MYYYDHFKWTALQSDRILEVLVIFPTFTNCNIKYHWYNYLHSCQRIRIQSNQVSYRPGGKNPNVRNWTTFLKRSEECLCTANLKFTG